MMIEKKWFKLYEQFYGTTFNRLLTVGSPNKGYTNFSIESIDDIKKMLETRDGTDNEFFISLYDYESDTKVIKWKQTELDNYEKYSKKTCILFRFKENNEAIREETSEMEGVQRFMFIRRSINLGSNMKIVEECKRTSDFFKEKYGVDPLVMFNGYDECLLYIFTNPLDIEKASLTCHNLYRALAETLNLETLLYETIEPFAQLVQLPGTQNPLSRLYTQICDINLKYIDFMKESEKRSFDTKNLDKLKPSEEFEKFLKNFNKKFLKEKDNRKIKYSELLE